ncbi:MAG: hypothetical protein ACE5HE_13585, partial [Phycisphaerae bacterium]
QDGEEDWFRFTIEEPRVIEVIVAPVGRVYDNSPQNFDGNCSSGNLIDSAAIADLGFELLGGDGSTVIATADDRNAGETESVNDLILNDAGDYYIRVFESDSPSGTQLYSLEVRAEVTIPPKVAMSPHDIPKNRYVSFAPDNFGLSAFQVELTASVEFPSSTGVLGWVSEPDTNGLSRIVDAPYFSDTWPAVVHVGDCAIVPAATY